MAFEKYKPRGLFSEFHGISQTKLNSDAINYVACESLGQAQFYRDHVKEKLWELLKLGLIPV